MVTAIWGTWVLFPMELTFWIDYSKINAGYIDMQQPGMACRILLE